MGTKKEPKTGRGANRAAGRGSRPLTPQSPKTPSTPTTPSAGRNENNEKKEIQKILEKLERLDKIDESISAQETKVSQMSDSLELMNVKCKENKSVCNRVREESAGIKAQVKVHGTRLADIESKIELLRERKEENHS